MTQPLSTHTQSHRPTPTRTHTRSSKLTMAGILSLSSSKATSSLSSKRVRACACYYSLALWTTWTVRSSQAFLFSSSSSSSSFARTSTHLLTTNHHLAVRAVAFPSTTATTGITAKLNMSTEETTVTEADIASNLKDVLGRIASCCEENGRKPSDVRLVAVSKTKPLELVQYAYKSGHRVFGENYAQELVEKAKEMEQHKDDIQWHFIGSLQSNKANMLVKGVVPYGKLVVETVSTVKMANKLDNAMEQFADDGTKKLEVFVQINTSGEDSKSGIDVTDNDAVVEVCKHIVNECDNLSLKGLMTIGAPGDDSCLDKLSECRTLVAKALDMDDAKELELSMGMSGDFEAAIAKQSTNIRVGSTIFGARHYPNRST